MLELKYYCDICNKVLEEKELLSPLLYKSEEGKPLYVLLIKLPVKMTEKTKFDLCRHCLDEFYNYIKKKQIRM